MPSVSPALPDPMRYLESDLKVNNDGTATICMNGKEYQARLFNSANEAVSYGNLTPENQREIARLMLQMLETKGVITTTGTTTKDVAIDAAGVHLRDRHTDYSHDDTAQYYEAFKRILEPDPTPSPLTPPPASAPTTPPADVSPIPYLPLSAPQEVHHHHHYYPPNKGPDSLMQEDDDTPLVFDRPPQDIDDTPAASLPRMAFRLVKVETDSPPTHPEAPAPSSQRNIAFRLKQVAQPILPPASPPAEPPKVAFRLTALPPETPTATPGTDTAFTLRRVSGQPSTTADSGGNTAFTLRQVSTQPTTAADSGGNTAFTLRQVSGQPSTAADSGGNTAFTLKQVSTQPAANTAFSLRQLNPTGVATPSPDISLLQSEITALRQELAARQAGPSSSSGPSPAEEAMRDRLQQLEGSLQEALLNAQGQQNMINSLRDREAQIQNQTEVLTQQLSASQQQEQSLRAEIEEARREIEARTAQLNAEQRARAALETGSRSSEADWSQGMEQAKQAEEQSRRELDELMVQLERLNDQLAKNVTDRLQWRAELGSLMQERDALLHENADLKAQLDLLRNQSPPLIFTPPDTPDSDDQSSPPSSSEPLPTVTSEASSSTPSNVESSIESMFTTMLNTTSKRTFALPPARNKGKVLIDEALLTRIGKEVIGAGTQTENAYRHFRYDIDRQNKPSSTLIDRQNKPSSTLRGWGLLLKDLYRKAHEKTLVLDVSQLTPVPGKRGEFQIDIAFGKAIGTQLLGAESQTEAALNAAQTAKTSRGRRSPSP